MNDHALDALLAEYVAPPVPAGLAARVAAAALALPQEPRLAYARRGTATKRHDRRGKWLRRPLLAGGVALGLAVSGAVAATLAGWRIDWPAIEKVLDGLPWLDRDTQPRSAVPPRAPPPAPAPLVVEPVPAEPIPAAPRADAAPPAPRAAPAPVETASVELPDQGPPPPEIPEARLIERRPAAQPLAADSVRPAPPPPATVEREAAIPIAERPATTQGVDELRLARERIERTERLRAARQAQIERLQRVKQRRERLRRLRRE